LCQSIIEELTTLLSPIVRPILAPETGATVIRITVKGLAKFMRKGPAGQRTVLRDFKYPREPEARAQTIYYAEARNGIREYHSSGNDPASLVGAVDALRKKADRAAGQTKIRLEHNIRAMETYLHHFSSKHFQILKSPNLAYFHGSVVVSSVPDLFVREGKSEKLIRIDLGADPTDEDMIRIILQVTYEAALAAGMNISPSHVLYLDISRGLQHSGARARTRLTRDIQAACENIEAMWDGIKKA
jgi:hypothetical protein